MGFQKRWSIPEIKQAVAAITIEIHSPYNDGWTQMGCKHDLYLLKCFIEDCYKDLTNFPGEDDWEKQRLVDILKK